MRDGSVVDKRFPMQILFTHRKGEGEKVQEKNECSQQYLHESVLPEDE